MNKIREDSSQRRQGIRVWSLSATRRFLVQFRASGLFNAAISYGAYLLDCRSPESRVKLPAE